MSTDIQERSFRFACRVVRLHRMVARSRGTDKTLVNQLLRAGTSVGANLEEAKAAQSKADFVCKTRIALKEAREAHYWLRLLVESGILEDSRVSSLMEEANELVAILTTIVRRAASAASRPAEG